VIRLKIIGGSLVRKKKKGLNIKKGSGYQIAKLKREKRSWGRQERPAGGSFRNMLGGLLEKRR